MSQEKLNPSGSHLLNATHPSTAMQRVFSGMQPTGPAHLGNYIGAISQWVKIQTNLMKEPENGKFAHISKDPSRLMLCAGLCVLLLQINRVLRY
jgi:hypothetical protein